MMIATPAAIKRSAAKCRGGRTPRTSFVEGALSPNDCLKESSLDGFEGVIGLEVHAHLLTKSKIFCGSSAEFGADPNSHTCPVCMGLPGALPVLNKTVVDFAVKAGLATHCKINRMSIFARKNYFYPDLPKGYQISQYEEPLCIDGHLDIFEKGGSSKRIRIKRIHMEEDAGKLVHEATIETSTYSLVDFNRSSVALLEIVSEPDIASPEEAVLYLKMLRDILIYLDICDGNMEEGSFRCDANVSVRRKGRRLHAQPPLLLMLLISIGLEMTYCALLRLSHWKQYPRAHERAVRSHRRCAPRLTFSTSSRRLKRRRERPASRLPSRPSSAPLTTA